MNKASTISVAVLLAACSAPLRQTLWTLASVPLYAQAPDAGRRMFESRCARCHGPEGAGGELGPAIAARIAARSDEELSALINGGLPGRGMPAFEIQPAELNSLLRFLRALAPLPERASAPAARKTVTTTDGQTLTGIVINEKSLELQLRSDDARIHLLRPVDGHFRRVSSESDWPTYHGEVSSNRYSVLGQINKTNVQRLAPKWVFSVPSSPALGRDAGGSRWPDVRHGSQ